jgi:hypothetical protein
MKLNIINLIIFIILIIIFIWIRLLPREHFTNSEELDNLKTSTLQYITDKHTNYIDSFNKITNFINTDLSNHNTRSYYLMTIRPYHVYINGNLNVENNCIMNGTIILNDVNINNVISNVKYPIGSFYTQYSAVDSNDLAIAFPYTESPIALFGGDWEAQWDEENVFFRTEGTLSNESRFPSGIQDYAYRHMYGFTPYYQFNLDSQGDSSLEYQKSLMPDYGVMPPYSINPKMKTESGGAGTHQGIKFIFDSARQSIPSENENRVKNRLIKVWKKISHDRNYLEEAYSDEIPIIKPEDADIINGYSFPLLSQAKIYSMYIQDCVGIYHDKGLYNDKDIYRLLRKINKANTNTNPIIRGYMVNWFYTYTPVNSIERLDTDRSTRFGSFEDAVFACNANPTATGIYKDKYGIYKIRSGAINKSSTPPSDNEKYFSKNKLMNNIINNDYVTRNDFKMFALTDNGLNTKENIRYNLYNEAVDACNADPLCNGFYNNATLLYEGYYLRYGNEFVVDTYYNQYGVHLTYIKQPNTSNRSNARYIPNFSSILYTPYISNVTIETSTYSQSTTDYMSQYPEFSNKEYSMLEPAINDCNNFSLCSGVKQNKTTSKYSLCINNINEKPTFKPSNDYDLLIKTDGLIDYKLIKYKQFNNYEIVVKDTDYNYYPKLQDAIALIDATPNKPTDVKYKGIYYTGNNINAPNGAQYYLLTEINMKPTTFNSIVYIKLF